MAQSIGDSLEKIADGVDATAGTFEVGLQTDDLTTLGGGKAISDVIDTIDALADSTVLSDLATQTTLATLLTEATATTLIGTITDAVDDAAGAGLPVKGYDAAGADTYATLIAATPDRVCHHMLVTFSTQPAVISLNGGTTDHLALPAGTYMFDGLNIPAAAVIQAKNLNAGDNYTLMHIAVW